MDLVEIKSDHAWLAENTNGIYFDNWFIYDWKNHLFSYYKKEIPFERICFTVGDDHIELYDCVFVEEPYTDIDPKIGGRLMTLVMHAKFTVKNAKVKGKMCIRNPKKEVPLITEFELELKSAELLQTVGFIIRGDSLVHNLCQYEFSAFNISFTYCSDSKIVPILDRETDASKRKLLENYLVETITKEMCTMIQEFEEDRLGIKQTVSELCGNNYKSRDILRTHNRISHAAMKNLANHIIDLTNDLVQEASEKLYLPRIYGLNKNNLKAYKAYISTLHTLAFEKSGYFTEEVIISNKDDCLILYVPVTFSELELHYKEVEEVSEDNDTEFENKQIYTTEKAHFKLSLKKNERDHVEFELLQFKIMNIKPIRGGYPIEMAMDHLVSSAVEEYIKSMMERALKDKKLQELAVNPKVHVEDDGDDLYESSDCDESDS